MSQNINSSNQRVFSSHPPHSHTHSQMRDNTHYGDTYHQPPPPSYPPHENKSHSYGYEDPYRSGGSYSYGRDYSSQNIPNELYEPYQPPQYVDTYQRSEFLPNTYQSSGSFDRRDQKSYSDSRPNQRYNSDSNLFRSQNYRNQDRRYNLNDLDKKVPDLDRNIYPLNDLPIVKPKYQSESVNDPIYSPYNQLNPNQMDTYPPRIQNLRNPSNDSRKYFRRKNYNNYNNNFNSNINSNPSQNSNQYPNQNSNQNSNQYPNHFNRSGLKRKDRDNDYIERRKLKNDYFKRKQNVMESRKKFFLENIEKIRREHPFPNDIHILQNNSPEVVDQFTASNRILDYNTEGKTKTYECRLDKEIITVNHWGQRKLLLSEIEFLTLFTNPDEEYTVVYAGAGPGTHTTYLSQLFPNVHFVLIDPLPENEWVAKVTDRIEIHYDYMTDELAKQFSFNEEIRNSFDPNQRKFNTPKDHVLFISDIRNTKHFQAKGLEQHEENIINDNQLQKKWHDIIQPEASMLKFRCPFYNVKNDTIEDRKYEYLDGDIYLPVWGKVETCECRLVVRRGNEIKAYDRKIFEEKMMYFNTVTRVQYYNHPYDNILKEKNIIGIDHCFDCRSELWILEQYLSKFTALDQEARKLKLVEMIQEITPKCSENNRALTFIEHVGLEIGQEIPLTLPDVDNYTSNEGPDAEYAEKMSFLDQTD